MLKYSFVLFAGDHGDYAEQIGLVAALGRFGGCGCCHPVQRTTDGRLHAMRVPATGGQPRASTETPSQKSQAQGQRLVHGTGEEAAGGVDHDGRSWLGGGQCRNFGAAGGARAHRAAVEPRTTPRTSAHHNRIPSGNAAASACHLPAPAA